jgi:hypothetical protein
MLVNLTIKLTNRIESLKLKGFTIVLHTFLLINYVGISN